MVIPLQQASSSEQAAATKAEQVRLPRQDARAYKRDRLKNLKHIIIISDDIRLVEEMQAELSCEGHQVTVIHDGLRGLLAVKRFSPDLVIVDWEQPRLTGLAICDRLRSSKGETPIILLTRGDDAQKRIDGFNAGADDCISIPFIKAEFIARVNAKLSSRQQSGDSSATLRCAGILLNRETREVFRGPDLIRLTAKEFDLLEFLMNHYFQVLTRTQILENVWGYDYTGNSNIIEVYIRYLRNKLGASEEQRLIHTIRGVGYIFREQ